jgi:uncharacterized protein
MVNYSQIDAPDLLQYIFYPRPDVTTPPENAVDFSVNVEPDIRVGCRFYQGEPSWPSILFFHGNGEVASDYDDLAPLYLTRGINLIVADYRGYGNSGGSPTLTDIAGDCHSVLSRTNEILQEKGFSRDLIIMGRSLGSISALEIASAHADRVKGMIIESGFTCILSIIFRLGLPLRGDFEGREEIEGQCDAIAKKVAVPALVIHGEEDSLVPVEEGRNLYQILSSMDKKLVIIEDADHNTIAFVDIDRYFQEIEDFVKKVSRR